MPSSRVDSPKDVELPVRKTTHGISKFNPLRFPHDKVFCSKWKVGKEGNSTLAIRDAVFTTKGNKRTSTH